MNMQKILATIAITVLSALCAQAAVVTNAGSGVAGGDYAARANHATYVIPFTYDARVNPVSATGDSVIVVNVLSNSYVRQVRYAVTVSNGSAATFGISDTGNSSQYVATVPGTALVTPTSSGTLVGRFYQSNNTVRLWFDTAATGLVVDGAVEIIDLTPR